MSMFVTVSTRPSRQHQILVLFTQVTTQNRLQKHRGAAHDALQAGSATAINAETAEQKCSSLPIEEQGDSDRGRGKPY